MRTSPVSRRAFAAGSASVAVSLIMPTMVAGKVPRPTAPPSEATGETTLRSLLAITLDFKGKDSAVPRETRFSNLLTHYNHFGLAPLKSSNEPTDPRIPTIFQIGGVPQDSSFISTEPEHWLELFGFHPFTIQAMLDQGPLDDYFLLVQGVFDQEAVFAAWERTGYAPSEGSSNIWQLNLDDGSRFDLAFGIGFFGFLGGSYDYASFLDEKTVVLASDPYYIEQAQDALNGLIESLLDSPTVGSLTQSMPSDSCRAFILKDRAFNEEVTSTNPNLSPAQREEVRSELEAIEAQHGPMPGIVAGILGRTPGGPYREGVAHELDTNQRATYVASIALVDPDNSQTYLDIATERFGVLYSVGLRERYRDLLTLESAQVVDGGIALMTFTQNGDVSHDLFDFYYAQDLQFLYW